MFIDARLDGFACLLCLLERLLKSLLILLQFIELVAMLFQIFTLLLHVLLLFLHTHGLFLFKTLLLMLKGLVFCSNFRLQAGEAILQLEIFYLIVTMIADTNAFWILLR